MKKIISSIFTWLHSPTATYLLVVLWLLVQAFLYHKYGVKLVPDSIRRYLPLSQAVAQGDFQVLDYNSRYLGYLLFLAAFIKFNLPHITIIICQTVVSGLAAVYLFKLALLLSGNKAAAFLATFLFITWPDIQYFNYFVLTESLFTSFLIFSYYAVLRAKVSFRSLLVTILILSFTSILRPNGFLVLVGGLAYMVSLNWQYLKHDRVASALLFCLMVSGGYIFINNWLHKSYNILAVYQQGDIIYGSRAFARPNQQPLNLPPPSLGSFSKIIYFIFNNPLLFLKLAGLKLLYFIGYIKPYHSALHKAATILVIYPMYILAGFSLNIRQFSWPSKLFGLVVFTGQCAIISLTVEDWDNRFSIPFLPYVFLLGSVGFKYMAEKKIFQN